MSSLFFLSSFFFFLFNARTGAIKDGCPFMNTGGEGNDVTPKNKITRLSRLSWLS